MRSSGLALIQYHSYPYEKEKFKHRDRHVQKEDDEDSSRSTMESGLDVASLNQEMPNIAGKPPEARTVSLTGILPQKEPTPMTLGSQTYSFQNLERINLCLLSHPVCDTCLWPAALAN